MYTPVSIKETSMKEYFEYDVNGCTKAKKYLEKIGKLKELEKERSMDGYTLVTLANRYLDTYPASPPIT
jgi:hypothetical protein